jgi:Uma2 family endonuclease
MSSTATLEPVAAPEQDGTPATDALYEVVDHQRVDLAPMSAYAGKVASLLGRKMANVAEEHRLGEVVNEVLFLLPLEREPQRRPDVAFVSFQRWPADRAVPDTDPWPVVPDLAVEVVSPTDRFEDVFAKAREHVQAGVRLVWVIAPQSQQVFAFEGSTRPRILAVPDDLDGGAVLPGFRMPLATLFRQTAASV